MNNRLRNRYFPVNFANFLRSPFFIPVFFVRLKSFSYREISFSFIFGAKYICLIAQMYFDPNNKYIVPIDTRRKLNVHKTFRRRPGRLLNVLCTFNLLPVSTGVCLYCKLSEAYLRPCQAFTVEIFFGK